MTGIAVALKTNSGSVFINPVNNPIVGQVLTATSPTTCEWITPPVSYTVSLTSLTIGFGIKTLTLAKSNKTLVIGNTLSLANSDGTGLMIGQVTNVVENVITLDVFSILGTGTFANWEVSYGVLMPQPKKYFSTGLLQTGTGSANWIPARTLRLKQISAAVLTAPTGLVNLTVLKNGISISQLSISSGNLNSAVNQIDLTLLTTDTVTINITASSGRDLTVTFIYY